MSCRKEYGLSRRFAPRNDMQKLAACPHNTWALPVYCRKASLQPLTPARLQHVIANQCAHWCGNPRPLAHGVRRKNRLAPAGGLHPLYVIVNRFLAPAHTYPSSACHCEPVRTLAWQSVLLAVVHGKSQHLRRIRNHPRIRLKCYFLFCAAAGVTDCPVASLLAMTGGRGVIAPNTSATTDAWQGSAHLTRQTRPCTR